MRFIGIVSIPQAVGTVATGEVHVLSGQRGEVSIPQAVGTVATLQILDAQKLICMFQYRKR